MPPTPAPAPAPSEQQTDRGLPVRARLLAVLIFLGVVAAVVGAVELVSPGNGWRHLKLWGIPISLVYWPLALRVMRRVYGARRVETEQRIQSGKEAKYRRWLIRYFLPIPALVVTILGGIDSGPAWLAWHGQGRPGWAVVEQRECSKTCSWSGTYRSDDGTVVRSDVWIWDPPKNVRIGDKIRVVDTDDRTAVFEASGEGARNNWFMSMAFFLAGGLYLAWWLGSITGVWRALFRDGENLV
jgi:hypothetical protein